MNKYYPAASRHLILTGMGYFLDGYNLNVIAAFSFILVRFHIFKYSNLQLALVSGIALLGAVFGAVIFGRFSDRFGRKKMYVTYPFLFILFPIIAAISWNINMVIISRFFVGVAIGADYAVGPVYSLERLSEATRGTGYGYIWAYWSLGAGASFFLGFFLLNYFGAITWRIIFAVASIPALMMLLMRLRLPESEKWLYGDQYTGIVSNDRKDSSSISKISAGARFSDIFKGNLKIRTIIVWTQWILLDIGSYGFNLYGPIIINDIGFSVLGSFLVTGSLYILGFFTALISMSWNDRFGRKPIQALGFGSMSLGMILIALSYVGAGAMSLYIGVVGLVLWYGFENIGPGNTMGLYAMELFPVKLRSTSMGSAAAVTRFISFLSAFEFPFIAFYAGYVAFFILLILVMLSALVFTVLFTPETRGMTLDEISNSTLKRGKLIP